MIRRVQLAKNNNDVTLHNTYITNTNDLFIVLHSNLDNRYKVYMLDLDKCNINELNVEKDQKIDVRKIHDDQWRIPEEPIIEYFHGDVLKRKLMQIHVRGSSWKDLQDLDE